MAKKLLYFIVHKPYKVLSQFTDESGNDGLRKVFPDLPADVYPVGRLDLDSEGLLILTNDKSLNNRLLNPKYQHKRTYWVEVAGEPKEMELNQLRNGLQININGKTHHTLPAEAKLVMPIVTPRIPPVNEQKHPDRNWLELTLTEGKNRQVRRMTAKIGHPTLRLIRVGIEDLQLQPLPAGAYTQISQKVMFKKLRLL